MRVFEWWPVLVRSRNSDTIIFWEVEERPAVLLESQKTNPDMTYCSLLKDLRKIAKKARKLANRKGGIKTAENFPEAHELAEELMVLLSGKNDSSYSKEYGYINRIHELLVKEDYFKSVFGAD